MNISNIYDKLDARLTDEDFWWLYVTLKYRFLQNKKYCKYVDLGSNYMDITNRICKTILNSAYGSNANRKWSIPFNLTINKVIFNDPATIIMWNDGTKSVVKCQNGEVFDAEKGFALAYLKKLLGNDNTFNKEINNWVKYDAVD